MIEQTIAAFAVNVDPSAVFGVLTVIVGGVCVLLLVSTKTLRDSRDDQEKRITQLEAERTRDKAELAGKDAQIDALGKVVTGEAYLVAISDQIAQHHSEAVRQWTHVTTTLDHLDQTMTKVGVALGEGQS